MDRQNKNDYSLHTVIGIKKKLLNLRLLRLKPYSQITYKPRSLEHQGLFRAIEYKYLLFFYLRYALNGLLPKNLIDHFESLSASIYILCKEKITKSELESASQMLCNFCDLFEKYYGIANVTLNFHLLRHYGQTVRDTGPLWSHCMFGFESNMGVLGKHALGSANIIEQIANKYLIGKNLAVHKPLDKTPKFVNNLHSISEYDDIIKEKGFMINGKIVKGTQISVAKNVYKSLASKPTKSIDYFVEMKDGQIGCALFYIDTLNGMQVLLRTYEVQNKRYHLSEISSKNTVCLYPFDFIKEKLLYLTFGSIEIVSKERNKFEK